MRRALSLASLVIASLVSAVGCAAPAEDDAGEDGQAIVVSKGQLAQRASQLATRLAKGPGKDRSVLRIPVVASDAMESTVLPSKTPAIGGWVMLAVSDGAAGETTARAYMLLPKGDAVPTGSFGLVLGDSATSVLATAVYVPDEARDASGWADKLLAAIPADAVGWDAPTGGGIRTQGVATELAKAGLSKIFGGLFRAAAEDATVVAARTTTTAAAQAGTRAEARVVKAEAGDLWGRFRNLASYSSLRGELLQMHRERLVEVAKSVLTKKSELVYFSSNAMSWGRFDEYQRLVAVLEKQVTSKSAIVVSLDDRMALPAVTYALEHDVPVVVVGVLPKDGVLSTLSSRLKYLAGDAAELAPLRDRFAALLADPRRVALVQTVDTAPFTSALNEQARHLSALNGSAAAGEEAQRRGRDLLELAPAWALADRAVEARVSGGYLGFNEFIRQFARLERVNMMPAGY